MESVPYIVVAGLFQLIRVVLGLLVWAIIISAILSWLVAFDVINLRNRFVANVAHFLDAVTRPILRPIQRIIPPLGGVDISPIIAILLIQYVLIAIVLRSLETAVLPLLY
ncbi:MAG TPA: YggT family protein [Caulobacteraceae bacterium]